MSFELRRGQSTGDNLSRIFRKQIDGALAVARGETEADDTRVHAIRKHLKKARAVLQLVRKKIGRKAFRRQDGWLRNVGRSIRELRDAEVRLYTMRQLEDETHHHYLSYRKIESLLELELENFLAAFDGWEWEAVPALTRARDAAKKWPVSRYRCKNLRRAFRSTYRRARKGLATARLHPSITNLHELRKRVKMLGYQLQILRPLQPIVVGALSEELDSLGDLLGQIHDLSFLAQRLRKERGELHWGKQDEDLLAVIDAKRAKLHRDGISIAAEFFASRRPVFSPYIKRWFKDWRRPNRLPAVKTFTPASADTR